MGIKKVSDNEFWEELRIQKGGFASTARALEKKYDVEYTRQAVEHRAKKDLDRLRSVKETITELVENIHFGLMMSEDEKIKIKAVQFYLRAKGGYTDVTTIEVTEKKPLTWMDEIISNNKEEK